MCRARTLASVVAILILAATACLSEGSGTGSTDQGYFDLTGRGRVQSSGTGGSQFTGLLPMPVKYDVGWPDASGEANLRNARANLMSTSTTLPQYYDLRQLGKLSPVRQQSPTECWAYASLASFESALLPFETWDFSENNLKNSVPEAACRTGGTMSYTTAYLSRWDGAVTEDDDPIDYSNCISPTGLSVVRRMSDVYYLPDTDHANPASDTNAKIKQAIMTYGAMYTAMSFRGAAFRNDTAAYYSTGGAGSSHAVCIVGWDDNYDRANFLATNPPPANGAWIVRNHGGPAWGDGGYFYVSYYSVAFGADNAVIVPEADPYLTGIYQYDYLGYTFSINTLGTNYSANVFTATSADKLAAVGLQALMANLPYELYIHLDPTNGPLSSSGPVLTQSGTFDYAGYHTIKLNQRIQLAAGQKFSVILKVTSPGYRFIIPADTGVSYPGQSFKSNDGITWSDIVTSFPNKRICIKAFTTNVASVDVAPEEVSVHAGPAGGPFSPTNRSYTLTNMGNSSVTWTASSSQNWITLSSSLGTLAPGGTATVTATLNSAANALAAGSYLSLVTFADATGVFATRKVGLTVKNGVMLVKSDSGCTFGGLRGGPFSPSSTAYTIINTGCANLNWTASRTATWLAVSPASGTLGPNQSATVTVSLGSAAATRLVGEYTDNITFTNTTNGSGNTTRTIRLRVGRCYVSQSGSDANNGLSWSGAKRTIQAAMDASAIGGEIWVAAGSYAGPILFKDGVKLYGGFAGTETSLSRRNLAAHESIIQGDGVATAVLFTSGAIGNSTRLDGFSIHSNTASTPPMTGGAIVCINGASPTIVNNSITGNRATHGGGIYLANGSTAVISANTISSNTAASQGGGIFSGSAGITISGNTIQGNVASAGGGLAMVSATTAAKVSGNRITGNTAGDTGGGLMLTTSNPNIVNNIIACNNAATAGAIYVGDNAPHIYNNTIVSNTANSGSALYYYNGSDSDAINNIIAYNNGRAICFNVSDPDVQGNYPTFSYNCFYQNAPGNAEGMADPVGSSNNISYNPMLLDASTGNYHLMCGSICINRGLTYTGLPDSDIEGHPRPYGMNHDIGAYEYGPWMKQIRENLPDGSVVAFGPVVVVGQMEPDGGCGNSYLFVESIEHTAGIRVDTPETFSLEDVVQVSGIVQTDALTGERYISCSDDTPVRENYTYQMRPVGVRNLWMTGGSQGLMPAIYGGFGFCNEGMYVHSWGRVTYRDPGELYFYVDDGSHLSDGTGHTGLRVRTPAYTPCPAVGSFVRVWGVAGTTNVLGRNVKLLRTRQASDIQTITWWVNDSVSLTAGQWNYLSLPGIPADPDPQSVFVACSGQPGLDLEGNLLRYDSRAQQWFDYVNCSSDGFGNVSIPDGFGLYVPTGGATCYSYTRTPMFNDLFISLPVGSSPMSAFSLVGHPYSWSVGWADVQVSDGTSLWTLPDAIAKGLVYGVQQWNGWSWIAVDVSDSSSTMSPGKAYKVFTSKDNLAILHFVL